MQALKCGLALVLVLVASRSAGAAPRIYVGEKAAPVESRAAAELQRHLYAATGEVCEIETSARVSGRASGFVLGTPESLPALDEAWPFGLEAPARDGYLLHTSAGGKLVVVAGMTPAAVQNGVYGLLETLGFGFYPSGDTFPFGLNLDRLPRVHESRSPAFETRGTLLRDTYFTGPAAWTFPDYRAYIDQLVKMRLNLVAFYATDEGPFAASEGTGGPLPDTLDGPWRQAPLPTGQYLAGTGAYFAADRFGGPGSTADEPGAGVEQAKEVLRRAFEYARSRGLRTGIGFDAQGDPTDPQVQARFDRRLRTLLKDYPAVDCVWVWAPEAAAVSTPGAPATRSLQGAFAARWNDAFSTVDDAGRRAAAVRQALFAQQAQRTLEGLRPDVTLVAAGWGGDHSWRYGEFMPGLEAMLPGTVAFAALDDLPAGPAVGAAYAALSPERPKWPVLWWEFDGDQWMPQPNLRELASACRDARAKGCQGLLGMHWRTRAVDDAAAYCARYAWDPQLTVEGYFARRACDLYGERLGAELAPYLVRLQDLGYRWVGGLGQFEPAPFVWDRGEESHRARLVQVGSDLRAKLNRDRLFPSMLPDVTAPLELGRDLLGVPLEIGRGLVRKPLKVGRQVVEAPLTLGRDIAGALLPEGAPPQWRANLEDLYAQLRFVVAYDRASSSLGEGGAFDTAASAGDAVSAVDALEQAQLADVLHFYARRIRNKGELGALAEMNAKAWASVRNRLGEEAVHRAMLEKLPEEYRSNPQLLVLPDRVICVGPDVDRAKAVVKVRPLDAKRFLDSPLTPVGRGTFALAFPEEADGWGSFAYGVEVTLPNGTALAWPAGFPAFFATEYAGPVPEGEAPSPVSAAPPADWKVKAEPSPDGSTARLTWPLLPGRMYRVSRNGEPLGTVYDTAFEDTAPVPGARYEVEAQHLATGETVRAAANAPALDIPLPDPPKNVEVASRGGVNVVAWDSDSPAAAGYLVTKYGPGQAPVGQFRVPADYGYRLRLAEPAVRDRAFSYTVAGTAPGGRNGAPTRPVGIIASSEALEPVVHLSLQDESRLLDSMAQVGANALALGGAGWSDLPPQPDWDPERPLTIALWVKLDSLFGMPVLLSRGPWADPAYYLQVFDGKVRFHVAGLGTLDAGELRTGAWQHVAATYGDGELRVYLDGEPVGRRRAGEQAPPVLGEAIEARQGVRGTPGFVEGVLDDIRIYRATLALEEIAALHGKPPAG